MLTALVHVAPVLAEAKSKVPFYICGGLLALWAVVVSLGIGLRRADFPTNLAGQRLVMGITAVLVAATAITAVATSSGEHNTAAAAVGGTQAGGNVSGGTAAGAPAPNTHPSTPAASTLTQSAAPSGALSFTKSVLHAKAGHVTITFANPAPEAHNLTVGRGALTLGATPTFQGGAKTLSLNLQPGTYQFFCTVPGHRQGGMQGTLIVSSS
jgi:plastocyanin